MPLKISGHSLRYFLICNLVIFHFRQFTANLAVDGNTNTVCCASCSSTTEIGGVYSWLAVDLGNAMQIRYIQFWARQDSGMILYRLTLKFIHHFQNEFSQKPLNIFTQLFVSRCTRQMIDKKLCINIKRFLRKFILKTV